MTLRKRFYSLIFCSLVWFVFGTMVMIRSSKHLDDLKKIEGSIEDIGVAESKKAGYMGFNRVIDILYLRISGLNQTLGIYHNTKQDYQSYLENLHKGDFVKIYFDENGIKASGDYNLHVYQLEKEGKVFLDSNKLNSRDKRLGFILYGIGLLFSIPAIWFYKKKLNAGLKHTPN